MPIRGNLSPYFHEDINYYRGKCAMCVSYNLLRPTYRGCECLRYTRKGLAFDDKCMHQINDKKRTIKDIKKAFENCRGYSPEVYYLVTTVKDILKNETACFYFDIFKDFFENIIFLNKKYQEFLTFYNFYGVLLAHEIRNDIDSQEICKAILKNFLIPIGSYIEMAQYDKALEEYIKMIDKLREIYAKSYDEYQSINMGWQLSKIRRF